MNRQAFIKLRAITVASHCFKQLLPRLITYPFIVTSESWGGGGTVLIKTASPFRGFYFLGEEGQREHLKPSEYQKDLTYIMKQ